MFETGRIYALIVSIIILVEKVLSSLTRAWVSFRGSHALSLSKM